MSVTINQQIVGTVAGFSMAVDGSMASVSIRWTNASGPTPAPRGVSVSLRGGKAYLGTTEIGTVPTDVTQSLAALGPKLVTLIEGLISSGKIAP